MSTNSTASVSEGTAIGAVTISGIQDVSGFLPLLGTGQCEEHVSNVLDRGWLYAAATPMSMFGSLGILQAGFYTFLVSIDCARWHGPRKLKNAGFVPKGFTVLGNLAYVDDTNDSLSIAEKKVRSMLERYARIDKITFHLEFFGHWAFWNINLITFTILLGVLGLTSFAYVIKVDLHGRPFSQTWLYPLMRVYGCAMATISIQVIIQFRTLAVVHDRLQFRVFDDWFKKRGEKPPHFWKSEFRAEDSLRRLKEDFDTGTYSAKYDEVLEEANLPGRYFASYVTSLLLLFRIILLCAIAIAGIGYVGCFGLIQSSNSVNSTGPAIWLALEVALCIIRLLIWAYNPTYDDPPPLIAIQTKEKTRKIIYEIGWTLGDEAVQDVHAIIIGNNTTSADNAESSAKSTYDCLLERFAVPEEQVTLIQGADSRDIENTLQNLATNPNIKFGASIVIYLACHAGRRDEPDEDTLFFMTADYSDLQEPGTGLPYRTLLRLIQEISNRKGNGITLILDTCYVGLIGNATQQFEESKHRKRRGISEYHSYLPNMSLLASWSEHSRDSHEVHLEESQPCDPHEAPHEESKGSSNPNSAIRPFTKALQTAIGELAARPWMGFFLLLLPNGFPKRIQKHLRGSKEYENQHVVLSEFMHGALYFLQYNNIFARASPKMRSLVLLTVDETSQKSQDPGQTV